MIRPGYEDRSSISRDGLRNPKPVNIMLFDKIDNILRCHSLHRDGLHPFGEIVYDGQNVLVTLARWRVDFVDHVHAPASECLWFDDGIHY
jgi:hypothetical protein